jgi:transcription initiation factor TFIIIB Brf1 subunit/transcription initiation factor TFIIB
MTLNLKTFVYKACPRCHGDLQLDRSVDPPEYVCVQCGRSISIRALLASFEQRRLAAASASASGEVSRDH